MHTELACFNQASTHNDILETIFVSSQQGISCVALPSSFLGRVNDFIKEQSFSAAVDFPFGFSTTQARAHEIILAIRSGASFIDLVLNSSYVAEENWRKVKEDIKPCIAICRQNDIELRAIVEYRLFTPKVVLQLCEVLARVGVTQIINSTGSGVDDIADNAIMAYQIQKETGLLVTACSSFLNINNISTFYKLGIYGIRFTSPRIAEDILKNGV